MAQKNKGYTYKEAHNKAVTSFQKNITTFFWIALLNLTGSLIGVIKTNIHYFPALPTNVFLFRLIDTLQGDIILLSIAKMVVAVIFSSAFFVIYLLAKRAKKYALFAGIGIYAADTILLFIYMLGENIFIPQVVVHLVVMTLLVFATTSYYHVFAIEKLYKKK